MTLSASGVVVDGNIRASSLTLGATPVTATGNDINKIAGLTNVTAADFGQLDGLTSNIQDQLDDKLDSTLAGTTYANKLEPIQLLQLELLMQVQLHQDLDQLM